MGHKINRKIHRTILLKDKPEDYLHKSIESHNMITLRQSILIIFDSFNGSKINKNDTVKTIGKSRSTQRSDTVNTVDKYVYIPGNILSNISTRIENPTEIYIVKENKNIFDFSLQGDDLSGIAPYILRIPRKNKKEYPRKFDH